MTTVIFNRYMFSDNDELCLEEIPNSTNSIHRSTFPPDARMQTVWEYEQIESYIPLYWRIVTVPKGSLFNGVHLLNCDKFLLSYASSWINCYSRIRVHADHILFAEPTHRPMMMSPDAPIHYDILKGTFHETSLKTLNFVPASPKLWKRILR